MRKIQFGNLPLSGPEIFTYLKQAVSPQLGKEVLFRETGGGTFHKRENVFDLPEVEVDAAPEMSYMCWCREWVNLNISSVRMPNNCHKPLQPQSHLTFMAPCILISFL